MEKLSSTILIPLMLYYLFFFLDAYKTRKGISPDASNEANPFSRYMYRQFPRWTITLLDIIFAFFVTVVAFSLSLFGGLWILYGFAFGHFLGFLSWTRVNRFRGRKTKNRNLLFFAFVFFAVVLGYVLAVTHKAFLPF